MKFDDICRAIGCFVVCAIVFAIPILTTCAFVFDWYGSIKWSLIILSIIDFAMIFTFIAENT